MNNPINDSTSLRGANIDGSAVSPDALTALERLIEGNRRYVQDVRSVASLSTAAQRAALASAQAPFAAVLSCADSRVPAEMVFDQGLGSLFVVRVAGNVVAPSLVGSLEYAVQVLGVRLIVVMGHTNCGAVKATIDQLDTPASGGSANVLDIVERIMPSVAPLAKTCGDRATLLSMATRANVRSSANQLRTASPLLAERLKANELLVVGAEYSLESGGVDMFDGVPSSVLDSMRRSES